MAISLPAVPFQAAYPQLVESVSVSRSGSRAMAFVEYADTYWTVQMRTVPLRASQRLLVEAFKDASRGGLTTVTYTPKHMCIPQAYWGQSAQTVFSDDFAYANTAALLAAWTAGGTTPLVTLVSGGMRVENGASAAAWSARSFTTVSGKTYRLTGNVVAKGSNTPRVYLGTSANGNTLGTYSASAIGTFTLDFTASGATTFITVTTNSVTLGQYVQVDDLLITDAAPLAPDNNGNLVSITNGNALSINSVDNGLTLAPGDLISLTTGDYNSLFRVQTGGVAAGNAIAITVEPTVPSYIAVGAVVTFKNPIANMRVSPSSFSIPDEPLPVATFTLVEIPK